jgi:hypothetical protein
VKQKAYRCHRCGKRRVSAVVRGPRANLILCPICAHAYDKAVEREHKLTPGEAL